MIDPDLSVYAVPTVVTLECEVYVLARSLQDARVQASKKDLAEDFEFDDENFSVTELSRAKINDFHYITTNKSPGAPGEPKIVDDYPPEDHPDYDESTDTVPDAPEGPDPDAQREQQRDDKQDFKDEPRDD